MRVRRIDTEKKTFRILITKVVVVMGSMMAAAEHGRILEDA